MAACTTFFRIPELVASLSPFLNTQDLAHLVRTNRLLSHACSPFFWSDLDIRHPDAALALIHCPQALQALKENLGNIRSLRTETNFISHYVIGLASFLDTSSSSSLAAKKRPSWLPSLTSYCPASTSSPPLLFFPPLTNLTRLSCSLSVGNLPCGPSWSADQLSLQLCHFVSLNVGLQNLAIDGLRLGDDLVLRVVARTISRLHSLKHLTLAPARKAHVGHGVAEILLFNCPPSIESFILDSEIVSGPMPPCMFPNDKDCDEEPVLVEKTPLVNLKELRLPENYAGYLADPLCSIMEQCPALESWIVPCVVHEEAGQELSDVLQKHCPKIRELFIRAPGKEQHGPTVISIMEKLPRHQLEVFYFKSYREFLPDRMLIALQRHSESLRKIRFDNCCTVGGRTIQMVLTECKVLEEFAIDGLAYFPSRVDLCLEDAVEFRWASSRLRCLQLVMTFGEFEDGAVDVEGSFSWTENDVYRWSLVKKLAEQIGRLRDLEVLDIRALNVATGSAVSRYHQVPVPGLLVLEDKTKNRFGFLDKLQGLHKLRELGGSFRINAMTMTTGIVGSRDVAWLSEHWPALQVVELMPINYEKSKEPVPECLQQLWLHRPDLAVTALYPFLRNNDRIRLLRTCRLLHNLFAPLVWNHLKLTPRVVPNRLIRSPEGLQALGRYTGSVLALETLSEFFKPYMDAVFEFACSSVDAVAVAPVGDTTQLEQLALSSSPSFLSSSATPPAIAPPKWLLQHQSDPQRQTPESCNSNNITFPPLPPMTNLTKFHCNISRLNLNSDKLQSLQICWLLRLNPNLNDIQLVNVLLGDPHFTRVFPRTLAGLTRLTQLHIEAASTPYTSFGTLKRIFESCPRSLEVLSMPFDIDYMTSSDQHSSTDNKGQGENDNGEDDDYAGVPMALRNGPLYRMKRLIMPTYRCGFPTSFIEFFLKDCPSLDKWGIPPLENPVVARQVGNLLNLHCPHLRHLTVKDASRCRHQPQDFIQIINTMLPGQLETLAVMWFSEAWPGELWEALRPHQAGARFHQLILINILSLSSRTLQALLQYCAGLKRLFVMGLDDRRAFLSLEDAAAFPWTCLNITNLCISMDLGGTNADKKYVQAAAAAARATEDSKEAAALSPFVWTAEEQECWKQLDRVYTNLGTLVHLDILSIRHVDQSSRDYMKKSLPGLLTLGSTEMNQPGFLKKLVGLKRLKAFRGSVWAFTDESKMMLRQEEVEWMVAEWPELELIDFLGHAGNRVVVPAPLQWLTQAKPLLKLHC
ncbi:hypothetical protein BGW39_001983 [Mortierella sp. 14UC]|nr:hypothetical protein BGW39_001983 [Mortierella sp. 14UC]